MSLRRNALIAIALTALLAIVGEWSGISGAGRFWCLPAGLLLLGLAYDALIARRAGVRLDVQAPSRWRLARAVDVTFRVAQSGSRTLEFELAPDAPPGVECSRELARRSLPPDQPVELRLRAVARRLGQRAWPAMRARIAGPLHLAWWRQSLGDAAAIAVEPDLLGETNGVAAPSGSASARASGAAPAARSCSCVRTPAAMRCAPSTGRPRRASAA